MGDQVRISRNVFGKASFNNVVDTTFNELAVTPPAISSAPIIGVQEFFQYYTELFYDIPMSGSYSGSTGLSHLDLINDSTAYLGISLTDMQQEIMNLRSENVALQSQIFVLTQSSGSA